ncbi:helix-turn-helix domain-containing protein [Amycolatopsis suaedae]|uniref:DNA-binding protein n=1 Tax=Amycolatopsis suaedae TaxID=2510978 RepID=A0A4Q7JCB0_9PSEU|nr:helix-turn-helix domain-containing protein [Amycolatopsis suaedae]RZQ65531.1 DNA-binding protein [Amycolatopsis suaedae]
MVLLGCGGRSGRAITVVFQLFQLVQLPIETIRTGPEPTRAVAQHRDQSLAQALRELADAVRSLAAERTRDPDALLTAEQVGELLAIPARTVKDRAAAGALPHRRFGKHYRFSRQDVVEIVRLASHGGETAGLWHTVSETMTGRTAGVPGTSVRMGRGAAGRASLRRRPPRNGF